MNISSHTPNDKRLSPTTGTSTSTNGKGKKAKKIRGLDESNNAIWFTERWQGQRFSLALKGDSDDENNNNNNINNNNNNNDNRRQGKTNNTDLQLPRGVLFHAQSDYQEILVFRSVQYGKVFAIDGMLQLTERDSFVFHEAMAHVPLFAHPNPQHVLIVGGGDGVVLQEVCRHPQVKHVTLVEIDPMVLHAAKEHLQLVPRDLFDDPRVEIVHADAADFLQDPAHRNQFDVILADTLDPLGPAESLFEPEFYEAMHEALRHGGIVCTQGESIWLHLDLIRDLIACCADIFDSVEYASVNVPSYPTGVIGFVLARKGVQTSCSIPLRRLTFQSVLKWYNPSMHRAAFVQPQYIQEELALTTKSTTTTVASMITTNGHIDAVLGVYLNGVEENADDEEDADDRCFLSGMCTIQ